MPIKIEKGRKNKKKQSLMRTIKRKKKIKRELLRHAHGLPNQSAMTT
jgi:hypothetical protein